MNTKFIVSTIILALFCFSGSAAAITLDNIVTPFSIPVHETYTANDWSSIEKIQGIRWSHKGFRETPQSSFVRSGKVKLDGVGQADVVFSGARTMVFEAVVTLEHPIDETEFSSTLKSQFSKLSSVVNLRASCKDEGLLNNSAVYQITLPKKKPIYLLLERSAGASGMEGITTFQFALEPDAGWKCKD